MAKRSRRRSSGGGGQRSFCPVIRIKCSKRTFSRAATASHGPGTPMQVKFAQMQAAKKKLRKAMGLGSVPALPWQKSLMTQAVPEAAVKKVAHAAANPAGSCTISMGGRSFKRKGAAVGTKVAELIRAQKAGGCCAPKIQRG